MSIQVFCYGFVAGCDTQEAEWLKKEPLKLVLLQNNSKYVPFPWSMLSLRPFCWIWEKSPLCSKYFKSACSMVTSSIENACWIHYSWSLISASVCALKNGKREKEDGLVAPNPWPFLIFLDKRSGLSGEDQFNLIDFSSHWVLGMNLVFQTTCKTDTFLSALITITLGWHHAMLTQLFSFNLKLFSFCVTVHNINPVFLIFFIFHDTASNQTTADLFRCKKSVTHKENMSIYHNETRSLHGTETYLRGTGQKLLLNTLFTECK